MGFLEGWIESSFSVGSVLDPVNTNPDSYLCIFGLYSIAFYQPRIRVFVQKPGSDAYERAGLMTQWGFSCHVSV